MQRLEPVEVEYPESDGLPMGESDLHRDWMNRIIEALKHRYRNQHVYVTGNLLLYYEEGNPRKHVSPDAMVVKNCRPGRRGTFRVWDEGRVPDAVFEVTSSSTRREDEIFKPKTYAQLGVAEYFLYDPTADYLSPPLQGHRLSEGEYVRIEPDARGRLESEELDLVLQLDEDGELVLTDRSSGERVLTPWEAVEGKLEALKAERMAAEERARRAEAEVERLRRLLGETDSEEE